MKEKFEKTGEWLLFISALLFSVSLPTSMALDNVAAGIGLLGISFLLITNYKKLKLPPLKPILSFSIPELLSSLFNPSLLKHLFKYTDLNHHLTPYFVAYRVFLEEKGKQLLNLLAFSTVISSLAVIFQALTHQSIKHLNFHAFHLFKTPIRAEGFFNHPLTTAGVLYLLFILFTFLFFKEKKKLYLTASLFSLIGIIFTQSRSYWLGIFLFFILLTAYNIRKSPKLSLSAILLLLISATSILYIPSLKGRFESIKDTKTNSSNMDRLAIWNAYLKAFKEEYSFRQILFGAGEEKVKLAEKHFEESFRKVYHLNKTPKNFLYHFHHGETHNVYLKFLSKYGIFGLLGYLIFFFYFIVINFKKGFPILSFGYLGFMTAGFFENNFTDAEVQFTLFFLMGLNLALIRKEKGCL